MWKWTPHGPQRYCFTTLCWRLSFRRPVCSKMNRSIPSIAPPLSLSLSVFQVWDDTTDFYVQFKLSHKMKNNISIFGDYLLNSVVLFSLWLSLFLFVNREYMWITTSNNGLNINASFIITPNIWFDSVKREILRCLIYDPINECAQNFHWSCLNCVQNLKTKANPRLTLSKQTGVTCKHTRIYLIFNSAGFFLFISEYHQKDITCTSFVHQDQRKKQTTIG